MNRLVSPNREATVKAGQAFDQPFHRSSSHQSGTGTDGKKPVRRERNLLPRHPISDSPQVGSAGAASDLIAIIASRRSAWSAPELAELLGCSGKHIYALAKSGRMPHLRIGGMIRFDPCVTAAWLRERFIAA